MGSASTAPGTVLDGQLNTATRRLCAGVYLNRHFLDLVVRGVHNDSRHRVAPSYGFDLVPVLEHARRAWVLRTVHQMCTFAVFTAGLLTDVTATVLAGCAIAAMPLVASLSSAFLKAVKLKGRSLSLKWRGKGVPAKEEQALKEQVHRFFLNLGGCAMLAAGVVFIADHARTSLSTSLPQGAVLLSVTAVLVAAAGVVRQLAVNRLHCAENLRPARLSKRSEVVDVQQTSALVVYGHRYSTYGTPSPFLGSGIVHRWPQWSIQLVRDEARNTDFITSDEPRFDAAELMQFLRKNATELGRSHEGPGLPGLHVRDRLFIVQEKVLSAQHLLVTEPTSDEMDEITNDPNSPLQHYLEVSVSRTGEVVSTLFIGLALRARTLNVDFALGMLTSLPYEFLSVDAHRENGVGAVFRSALRAVRDLPREAGDAWRLFVAPWVVARALYARRDRALIPKRNKGIGPRFSIRQEIERYDRSRDVAFDRREIEENKNVVLNTLLDSIIEFLKAKGMDVSAVKGQVTTIINANVFSSGELKIDNSAVGPNAQVNQPNPDNPGNKPGAEA
ncbi:hypothetical protein [Lentzea californiensis]|uniref:hypothetical protein n=1 Tax=Lentzea californiensis TaxID=438851 RepID=UPI002164F4FD|nr:hypothetical protein [Lentzea californiensis]MCR3753737.1 hypothetical protein [Lentzea californiensis]